MGHPCHLLQSTSKASYMMMMSIQESSQQHGLSNTVMLKTRPQASPGDVESQDGSEPEDLVVGRENMETDLELKLHVMGSQMLFTQMLAELNRGFVFFECTTE